MDDLNYKTDLQDGDILGRWGWDFITVIPMFGNFFLLDALKRSTKKTQEDFLISIPKYLNLILNFSRSSSIVT